MTMSQCLYCWLTHASRVTTTHLSIDLTKKSIFFRHTCHADKERERENIRSHLIQLTTELVLESLTQGNQLTIESEPCRSFVVHFYAHSILFLFAFIPCSDRKLNKNVWKMKMKKKLKKNYRFVSDSRIFVSTDPHQCFDRNRNDVSPKMKTKNSPNHTPKQPSQLSQSVSIRFTVWISLFFGFPINDHTITSTKRKILMNNFIPKNLWKFTPNPEYDSFHFYTLLLLWARDARRSNVDASIH